jgi:hypothetical protein
MGRTILTLLSVVALQASAADIPDLQVGIAGHAFDHLGSIGAQADAAVASGANIIYITGLGGLGYNGLPALQEIQHQRDTTRTYIKEAKRKGVHLAIGYVCATSIVNLKTFDQNWPADLRSRLHSTPAEWRQQSKDGAPLPSWYGGEYQPACMNNPDWRAYEKYIVRQQLDSGCDGIFFDNPTVHPQGCYCQHCMNKFQDLLAHQHSYTGSTNSLAAMRAYAASHPSEFLRFRCTIAREFLAEMRAYARSINRHALITANNSLNSTDALFAQCRNYAYNIHEMSQAEDFVVVEDMSSQPRTLPNGQVIEYGPTYEQLHAISHGKPIVAVTLADSDYHTPPNLVRLAQAEATAHGASYLSWPTWPEKERQRMSSLIRPQADFLRRNARLLNESVRRTDAVLFLPFRKWQSTNLCVASRLAAALTRANIQYLILCEDDLMSPAFKTAAQNGAKTLITESLSDFTSDETKMVQAFQQVMGNVVTADHTNWLKEVRARIGSPSLEVQGPATVRAIVSDSPKRTIIQMYNLNIQRRSSFEDQVTPATDVIVTCRIPRKQVRAIHALSADANSTTGPLQFRTKGTDDEQVVLVQAKVPSLEISTIVVVE